MNREMGAQDIKIGSYVEPIRGRNRPPWTKGIDWPKQISEIHRSNPLIFKLSGLTFWWRTEGLCIVEEVVENE